MVKVAKGRLKQLIREELHRLREGTALPDVQDAIEKNRDSWDLVEIINEIGALVAQNHYNLILKYDMGSMDLAGDIITEFEETLAPYIDDYFGDEASEQTKLGKMLEWLDEAIRDELEERSQNVY